MRCPGCNYPIFYGNCPKCMNLVNLSANPAFDLSELSSKCQHCGQTDFDAWNRCRYCNGILKCLMCTNDVEKFVLPEVKPLPLAHCKNPYGNIPDEHIVQHSASFLEFEDFVNFSRINKYIYNAFCSPPVTRNHGGAIVTNSGCTIVTDDREYEGLRIEHICKKCLNKIKEISFSGCELRGTLPIMHNLKKLSFNDCKLSRILPNMRIDELHLQRCEITMGIIEFISRVTVNTRIQWEPSIKDIDKIISDVRQMRNLNITIIIHEYGSQISTEKWGLLFSEAIAGNNICLVRWQYVSWQKSTRIIATHYLPGIKHNYYCTKCWGGFDKVRTCNCLCREYYIYNDGNMKVYVPEPLTPIKWDQQMAPKASNGIEGLVNHHDSAQPVFLTAWQNHLNFLQDLINKSLVAPRQELPQHRLAKYHVSPPLTAEPEVLQALAQRLMRGPGIPAPFSEQQHQIQQPLVHCTTTCTAQSAPYLNTAPVQRPPLGMPEMMNPSTLMQHPQVQNQTNTSPEQLVSAQHPIPDQVFTPPLINQQLQNQQNRQSDQNRKR